MSPKRSNRDSIPGLDQRRKTAVRGTGRFGRHDRLLDSRDFRRLSRLGSRRANAELVVLFVPRTDESKATEARSRLGVTVGRKVGNAVARNRFKRRIREWFRIHRGELVAPLDLIVIARKPAARLSYAELDSRLHDLLRSELQEAGQA